MLVKMHISLRKFRGEGAFLKRAAAEVVNFYRLSVSYKYKSKIKKIGEDAFIQGIEERVKREVDKEKSNIISRISMKMYGIHLSSARFKLAMKSVDYGVSESSLYALFSAAQECGNVDAAWSAFKKFESLRKNSLKSRFYYRRMKASPVSIFSLTELVGKSRINRAMGSGKKICYILNNSLPYSSIGYATRSQGMAECLNENGFQVVGITRPGFPLDAGLGIKNKKDVLLIERVNGIEYHRVLYPNKKEMSLLEYVEKSAEALEKKIKEFEPGLVISASNYICGMPALIASRRIGVPFIYEVRGFWELSRASREPSYSNSVGFKVQEAMEAFVANSADHVFTLTKAMKEELVRRGVDSDKITLLPNCCDPDKFYHKPTDTELKVQLGIDEVSVVIGYIGTFSQYEGLDDLARACGILHERGVDFRLLLVGDENTLADSRGSISGKIRAIASDKGFLDKLVMPGRVPHGDVERYYSIIDIAPFPRKALPICEMVSPMKTLEALSSEKAVVVSSVGALEEMINDNETGLVFDKGNFRDLADKLEILVKRPDLRRRLGRKGRDWVCGQRTWKGLGNIAKSVIADRFLDARVNGDISER